MRVARGAGDRPSDERPGEQRQARQAAVRRGRRGEWLAVLALRLQGYRILARDLRYPVGEIDIVARRGATLAIIEVKARNDAATAVDAVTPRQRRRIAHAARMFLAGRPGLAQLSIRFDIVVVTPGALLPGRWPRHLQDAWRPGEPAG